MLVSIKRIPWKKVLRYALTRAPIAILPLALVFLMESLSRVSTAQAYEWMLQQPDELSLDYGIALSVTALLTALIGRTRVAYAAVFLGLGAVALASGVKTNQTGTPLFLWDMVFKNETIDAAAQLNSPYTPGLLTIAAVAAAVLATLLLFAKPIFIHPGWKERTAIGVISLFFLFAICTDEPIPFKDNAGIFTIGWDQADNYARNGYLLASAMGIELVRVTKPPGMQSEGISKLVRSFEPKPGSNAQTPAKKPNVIVLLSESFWDPTRMKNVSFSEDPIPFFRSTMQSSTSGWMLSPQFGGGTANVEFEVLSGNSMRFLPKDAIAYIEYLNRGVDSLASLFSRQGYTATALNPYFNWFFNSRNVYKNFGFARFISSEQFDPIYHGPQLEDRQVMERVIAMTDSTPGPDFIFANTMENHGPYKDKFGFNPISVSGPITADSKNMLANYATGIRAFDDALRKLIGHYAQNGEPTIVLCFGDHLPSLGDNYQVYKDAKYITGHDDPDFLAKMYSTPFFIWSNFDTGPRRELRLSPSYLGPYMLHLAGLQGTYYTDFLYDLSAKIPVIPPKKYYDDMHIDENQLLDYERLQYDRLFGKRIGYHETGIREQIIHPDFALGYGQPSVSKADVTDDTTLQVEGEHFTDECAVWLNGTKLETRVNDTRTLTATLPKDLKDRAAPAQIKVRLTDDKRTIIAESETFTVQNLATMPINAH